MTMTAPDLRELAPNEGWVDAKGGVRCWHCSRVLHRVSIDPANRPDMVEGRRCPHCRNYCIVDYAHIRIEIV